MAEFSEHRAPLSADSTSTLLRTKANQNLFKERVTENISAGAHFTDTTEENNSVTSEVNSRFLVGTPPPSRAQYGDELTAADALITSGSFGNAVQLPDSKCVSLPASNLDQYNDADYGKVSGDNEDLPSYQGFDNGTVQMSLFHFVVCVVQYAATLPGIEYTQWSWKSTLFVLLVLNTSCASGTSACERSLRCNQDLSRPLSSGVTVLCTCSVTPGVVTQWHVTSTNGSTCTISLTSRSPCNGTSLSNRSCNKYISAASNASACEISTITVITDPSINNTRIACTDPSTKLTYYENVTIEDLPAVSGTSITTGSSSASQSCYVSPWLMQLSILIIWYISNSE